MPNTVSPRSARSVELSLFQMRINEGKEAMRRAKKGGQLIARIAKHIRQKRVAPESATEDQVEAAYFVIGNDTANAIQLVVALLRQNSNCINDQALIMMIASFCNFDRTLQELRPNVISQASGPLAVSADEETP